MEPNLSAGNTKKMEFQYKKKIEWALTKLLKRKVRIIGAGRTDKGVKCYGSVRKF